MNKLSINGATFLLLTTASTLTFAAAVDETSFTTFAADTPAVAAEVNNNFTALKNTINANDGTSTTHAADTAAHHSKYTDAEAATAAGTPIATHTAVTDAHHTKYTDAEAATAAGTPIATHTAVTDAHHSKYTDAEAATAAGGPIATHTAITNAHHSKYTNAEAVTAIIAADGTGSTLDADLLDGLDSTAFVSSACPSDMVKVGSFCIDRYEASVTDLANTPQINTFCLANSSDCSDSDSAGTPLVTAIFAKSVAGATPATSFTWFQAQQACANVGKRLPTNAEWQMAAAGTPNPTAIGTDCVVNTAGIQNTGSVALCVSNFGAFDMVGNVLEWVADWVQGPASETTGSASATFGDDRMVAQNATNQGAGTNMPAAILRGGSQATPTADAGVFFFASDNSPAIQDGNVGFRCAK